MNLFDLADKMDKIAARLPVQVTEIKRRAALFLVEQLAWETPVDTSQALSNWVASVGKPTTAFIDAHTPGFNGYTAASSARATVAAAKLALVGANLRQSIWLANNAPYIIDLNKGSSRQAPAMFVEALVYMTRQQIQTIAKEVFSDRTYRY